MSFKTIAEVRAANKAAGFFFFDRKTMRFSRSRVVSSLYAGRFFVTSEVAPLGVARYTVREALPSGEVRTSGVFGGFVTCDGAREVARNLAREVRK